MRKSLTPKQSIVLKTLTQSGEPMSAYGLLDELKKDGFNAPLQIYRALDKLIELGHVHKLESLNTFMACQDEHHHEDNETCAFAICDQCGSVHEVLDVQLADKIKEIPNLSGFQINRTTLEIKGTCANCAAKAAE